jgi:hypothetical protein
MTIKPQNEVGCKNQRTEKQKKGIYDFTLKSEIKKYHKYF